MSELDGMTKPESSLSPETAISRPGGVKALLNQLNSKFADSHVALPDGSVPTTKSLPVPRHKSGRNLSNIENDGFGRPGSGSGAPFEPLHNNEASDDSSGGASGVKARLKEINSKYTNSFVKLPDGTVPVKALEAKQKRVEDHLEGLFNLQIDESESTTYPPDPSDTVAGEQAPTVSSPTSHIQKPVSYENSAFPSADNSAYPAPTMPTYPTSQAPTSARKDSEDSSFRSGASTLFSDPTAGVQQAQAAYSDYGAGAVLFSDYQTPMGGETRPQTERRPEVFPAAPPLITPPSHTPYAASNPQHRPGVLTADSRTGYNQQGSPYARPQVPTFSGHMQNSQYPAAPPLANPALAQKHVVPSGQYPAGDQYGANYAQKNYHARDPMQRPQVTPAMQRPQVTPHAQMPQAPMTPQPVAPQPVPAQRPGLTPEALEAMYRQQQQKQLLANQALQHQQQAEVPVSPVCYSDYDPSYPRHQPAAHSIYDPSTRAYSAAEPPVVVGMQQGMRPRSVSDINHNAVKGGAGMQPRDFAIMALEQVQGDHADVVNRTSQSGHDLKYGIGVSFKPDEKRYLEVVKLSPGGTGEESGLILVGDKLRFVDGVDVTKITATEFTELIMGPNGSTVTLSFQKPGKNSEEALVHVALNRGPAGVCPPSPVVTSSSLMPKVLIPKAVRSLAMDSNGASSPVMTSSNSSPRLPSMAHSAPKVPSMVQSRMVGVGIIFNTDEAGALRVKGLAPGGPAAATGLIRLHDILVEIDGKEVYQHSVSRVQDEVVGPINSVVVLGFKRDPHQAQVQRVNVVRIWDASQEEMNSSMSSNQGLPVSVRPSKIIEMLYLGDSGVSRNREVLREEGIGTIVNVAYECTNHFEGEIAYLHIPLEDKASQNLRSCFDEASEFMQDSMQDNIPVMVHCTGGESRGAAVCVAFLMRNKRATLLQSWKLVKRVRPLMRPNHGFFSQLVAFELELFGKNTMVESDYASAITS